MIRFLLAALCCATTLPALAAAPRCERDALTLSSRIDKATAGLKPETVIGPDGSKANHYQSDAGGLIVESSQDGLTSIRYYSKDGKLRYLRGFSASRQGKRIVSHTGRLSWKEDGSRCDGASYVRGKTTKPDAAAVASYQAGWQTLRLANDAGAPVPRTVSAPTPRAVTAPIRVAAPAFVAPGESVSRTPRWR
ncbi:hypothetical protein [Jeongeupia naejangsanensis]|uniref:Uncharacterized protein n=1 Tax=Jeongeupia naejangsanensis TaxID=613195 RepID=A0ABS2BKA1_9NEIS|nr:hypothetical protein [Jeongeupia naejangsanensis]MBM3116021.1 hypothetical protein [Jeongeupia naejangsanensis]